MWWDEIAWQDLRVISFIQPWMIGPIWSVVRLAIGSESGRFLDG
ncbi:hypothetical protein AB71_2929 [Escherichia coli 1-182-04_S1_C3]|nr:hypothetical protein AB71_2929 [Escherichia coli 1-182-04_S1_C3]EZK29747.1 hypothetical protein AB12_2715 [Escherichia coli 1-182-04_S1_C1]